MRPLETINEIRVLDSAGDVVVLDSILYAVDTRSERPRLTSRSGYWPLPGATLNGIEIDFTAGYGPDATSVPEDLRQAVLALVAHWYEHRGLQLPDSKPVAIPDAVSLLLAPYRAVRI